MAYCNAEDVTNLLGDVRVRVDSDPATFAQKASDEIDSVLGFIYQTPFFDITSYPSGTTVDRVAKLLLQRIASFIGAARLIMSYDQQGEDNKPNQYAVYLMTEASEALDAVRDGKIALAGAIQLNPSIELGSRVGISNLDSFSQVESLYGWASRPTRIPGPYPDLFPSSYPGVYVSGDYWWP